jgi:hypothetical protein
MQSKSLSTFSPVRDRQRVVGILVIFTFLILVTLPFWLSPCTAMILYRKLGKKIFPSKETACGLSPNFYNHISVSDLYTEIGTEAAQFDFWNLSYIHLRSSVCHPVILSSCHPVCRCCGTLSYSLCFRYRIKLTKEPRWMVSRGRD